MNKVKREKGKVQSLLIVTLLVITICFLLFLPTTNYQLPTVYAQSCLDSTANARAQGLITTPTMPTLGGIFKFRTSAGVCVVNNAAAQLGPYLTCIDYDCLKATFYTNSKSLNKFPITSLPGNFSGNNLYSVTGDLTISGSSPTGSGAQVIFVDGNLNINSDYTYGDPNSGTVFVVRGGPTHIGGVYISPSVVRIDAVIISTGVIDTGATPGCNGISCQLVINGSLVSLNTTGQGIFFRRDLGSANSTSPGERVNYQPKYLIILRDLFSQTDQRWSEIAGRINVPAPAAGSPPGAPTGVPNAIAGNASAQVTWNPPSDPGTSPIIDYTVTANQGGFSATSTSSPATVTGLTNGTSYTFTVTARNQSGSGQPSAPSNSVIPQALSTTVVTSLITSYTSTSAVLPGAANPNGSAATGWFRYWTSNPGSCSDVGGTRVPSSGGSPLGSGSTSVIYSQTANSLSTDTLYWYCAIAINGAPTPGFGNIFSFTIPGVQTPYPGPGTPTLPGTIEAENFDCGGEGVAYHDQTNPTSNAGQGPTGFRYYECGSTTNLSGVDIQNTLDVGGGYHVGFVRGDNPEWIEYTVNVPSSGNYILNIRVSYYDPSATPGGTFRVLFNGVNVTGTVTVPFTGSWDTWTTLSIPVTLSAGTNEVMRFEVIGPGACSGCIFVGNFNWFQIQ